MNVLVVSDYYLPHWTGISKSLSYTLHVLAKKNNVTVLTIQYEKILKKRETNEGIKVVRLPYFISLSRAKFNPFFTFFALHYIFQTDIVLINSPSAHIFPLAWFVKILGKKLVVLHQGDLILPHGFTNKCIEKIFDIGSFLSCLTADKIATFTDDYAQHSRLLKYFLPKTITFIPPLPKVKRSTNISLQKKLNTLKKESSVLYGFAGRFVEEKGFDLLLKAIPLVTKKIPDAYFVYAGNGVKYERMYENTMKTESTRLLPLTELGFLNDSDLQLFYRSINFIVLPSRSDCFPFVQEEAMYTGTPSVVSDIPGARFLVLHSGFGKVYSPNTSESLAKALVDIYRTQDTIKKKYNNLLVLLNKKKNEELIDTFIES